MEKLVTWFSLYPFLFSSLVPLLFALVLLIIKWVASPGGHKRLPPSPPKLPIIGNLHQLGRYPHRSLRDLARRHGPLMLLRLGSRPTLVASSPEAAREIMKTHDVIFASRPRTQIGERLLYDCKDLTSSPYGELWRQLKSIFVLRLLSNRRVQAFRKVREEETDLMMNKIQGSCNSGDPVNLSEMFTLLTYDVVSRAAFGRKYSGRESGKRFVGLMGEFFELLGSNNVGGLIPWLGWVNHVTGFSARLERVAKEVDEFMEEVVEERVNMKSSSNIGDDKQADQVDVDEDTEDFLDVLLRIHNNKTAAAGVSIDRDSLKGLILDTFAGGTDTTFTLLEWTMTELLKHPRVTKKVQEEVNEIVEDKHSITNQELVEMHYLKAVIKETLRLHPPVPLLVPRIASEDIRVMGYEIAAGTMVIANAWAIGRDPESWADPESFQPERFLNSSVDYKGHDFELIPFGAGRRGCPGMSFAMATVELVLANLLHKFNWALPDGVSREDLDMTEATGVTVRRKVPLLAVATPRLISTN